MKQKSTKNQLIIRGFVLLSGLFNTCTVLSQTLFEALPNQRPLTGQSDQHSININNKNGINYQDVKKAAGLMVINGSACGCTMLNNVKQELKAYVITAAPCLGDNAAVGTDIDNVYITFQYEMAHADDRVYDNHPEARIITRMERVSIRPLVINRTARIALFEITGAQTPVALQDLLQYTYAAGWNNSLSYRESRPLADDYSHDSGYPTVAISHSDMDDKKFNERDATDYSNYDIINNFLSNYLRFRRMINQNEVVLKGFFYMESDNQLLSRPLVGEGLFNKLGRLVGVYSHQDQNNNNFSFIKNAWNAQPGGVRGLRRYLDPQNTFTNSIPGAYFLDRISTGDARFRLHLAGNSSVNTPPIPFVHLTGREQEPYVLPGVVYIQRNLATIRKVFNNNILSPSHFPLGIKLHNANSSRVYLLLDYLHKPLPNSGDNVTKRLLYGVYADNTVPPNSRGFRKQSWGCFQAVANGFFNCNRPPSLNTANNARDSDFISFGMLNQARNNGNNFQSRATRPMHVDISLQNRGADTVKVDAVGFPGDVPRNAKQLFYPAEFDAMFQSKKYHPSRGNDPGNLHIDNLEITQPREEGTPKRIVIPTGNNGGYLNLVNPNFKIFRDDDVTLTYHDANGELKEYPLEFTINLHNPQNTTFSYAVYLDYFNTGPLGGVRPDDFTYNFIHDPTPHAVELVKGGVNQTGNQIHFTYPLPHHWRVALPPGKTRKTRLRIAVKRGAGNNGPRQGEIFIKGEVEDYLIEIGVPDCAKLIPEAYKVYAGAIIGYCNKYLSQKDSTSGGLKRKFDEAGISSTTGRSTNQKYAKTKAISSWYASKAAFDAETKMSPPPVDPAFSGTFDPKWFSVADDLQETDPGQQIDQNLMMDIYYPEAEEGATFNDLSALPVIVYLPGGAFAWNMRQTELTEKTCQWLASRGYVVAAIDYRVGIHVGNEQVAKRAMIRAWQDSRAAVKWWGMPQNHTRSEADGHPLWKIDPERIYTVGHGAGGITAMHNLHLYPALLDAETGTDDTPGNLWAVGGGYALNDNDTYDLRQYPAIPCIALSDGSNTCDLIEHAPADPANGYFAVPGGQPLAQAALSQYLALDGRAKESVSLAGGILETDWLTNASSTPGPSLVIHHEDDAVISNQTAAMNVRNNGDIIATDVATLSGGAAMYADWNTATSDKGTLLWLELDNDDSQTGGGGGDIWPYHPVLMEEGEEYDAYVEGEGDVPLSLDEALLYYIDVFFMTNRDGGASTRLATQEVAKPTTPPEAEVAPEAFHLFPNPAGDQVNIIVTVKESGPLEVAFTDMQGRRVYHHCTDYLASGTQWVRLGDLNLTGGTYIVHIKATGLTKQKKLIIDRK